jgi:O-antigen ligase
VLGLSATLLLLAPVAVLAPKGMAVLMPALALLFALATRPAPQAVARAAAPALPLLAIAAASALWSITPLGTATRAALFGLEIAAASLLAASLPGAALAVLPAAVAAGAALTLAELAAGGPLTQALRGMPAEAVLAALSNGTTVMLLLAPAAAAAAWRNGQRGSAVAAVALPALAALAGGQVSARLGLLAAGGAALLALAWRPAIRAGAGLAAALIMATPLLLPAPVTLACRLAAIKLSVTHRLFIWNFAETQREARPLLGWGMEATRAIPGGRAHADLWTPCGLAVPGTPPPTELLPLHTHNAALQVWLELGPLGALALAALVVWLGWRARAADAAGRAAQAATLAAAVVVALISYGAWQGWWVATLAIAVAFASALNPASGRHPPPPSGR